MSSHFQRQIDKLKQMILWEGTLVEESVESAIRAVKTRDVRLARQVIQGDAKIDEMEIDVEEECLHALALYQPVAFDLRFVVSVLKINGDLERIADKAVNIAEQALQLAEHPPADAVPFDFLGQSERVRSMLKRSLDALVSVDAELAKSVRRTDDQVDVVHRDLQRAVKQALREHPDQVDGLLNLLSLSRQLERIADHAVNVAEDVIYMAEGNILRHSHENADDQSVVPNRPMPRSAAGEPAPRRAL
jgi:phosphate transport system protein